MNEVEFKFTLTLEEYEKLIRDLDKTLVATKTYWNIYYDTPGLDIQRAGCCLRITLHEDGEGGFCKLKATFKGKNAKDDRGLNSREEVEVELPGSLTKKEFFAKYGLLWSEDQIGEPWKRTNKHARGHVHLWPIGGVKIHRKNYAYKNMLLEIDRVAFNKDICDYELEVETDEPDLAYPQILDLLESKNIKPVPSRCGKHGRFLQHRVECGKEQVFSW